MHYHQPLLRHYLAHLCFISVVIACEFLTAAHAHAHAQAPIFSDQFEIDRSPVTRHLMVTPGALLLTARAESARLHAVLLDATNQPIAASIRWRSSDPAAVSVDANGQVTAATDLGSALITAAAPGALPVTVMVSVADPVDGAILVSDEQVLSAPVPVNPNADYALGYQYRVTLQDLAVIPAVGDILVGSGDTPLGGRVLDISVNGSQVIITLELVALEVMFDQLDIQQTIPPRPRPHRTAGRVNRCLQCPAAG